MVNSEVLSRRYSGFHSVPCSALSCIAFPVVSEWCQKVVDYVAGPFCSIGE